MDRLFPSTAFISADETSPSIFAFIFYQDHSCYIGYLGFPQSVNAITTPSQISKKKTPTKMADVTFL